jgi:1,4-dihydroxy-2-naphthoate octaprenyltransferase
MIKKIIFWLNCARLYTLPITILSWAVIFVYGITHFGNILSGILALVGISLVHLSTNLIDDYFDYKVLVKNEECKKKTKGFKCAYLKDGLATVNDLRNVIFLFLGLAILIGGYFFFTVGAWVAMLAIIGLLIALSYPKLSQNGLGDIAVIIAYGPLFFEGVFYVMCGHFSMEVLCLSFGCGFLVNTILYTHMIMDYDADESSHKITLCRLLGSKEKALRFLAIFYLGGYAFVGYLGVITSNYLYFLPVLTLPMAVDLYNNLKIYNNDKTHLPNLQFWHYPLDKWEVIKTTDDAPFYFRFIYSRNIVMLFMLLTCFAIVFAG